MGPHEPAARCAPPLRGASTGAAPRRTRMSSLKNIATAIALSAAAGLCGAGCTATTDGAAGDEAIDRETGEASQAQCAVPVPVGCSVPVPAPVGVATPVPTPYAVPVEAPVGVATPVPT